MPLNNPSYVAGEDLAPARFVKRSTSENNAVVYADDGTALIVGITRNGTREAPIPSVTETLAAEDGEPVMVHGLGDRCEVELGETISTDGVELTASTDGVAVTATGGDYVAAIAERNGTSGDTIWVQVVGYQKNA
jgi:hypothetical protein